jgi:hypothetical protein
MGFQSDAECKFEWKSKFCVCALRKHGSSLGRCEWMDGLSLQAKQRRRHKNQATPMLHSPRSGLGFLPWRFNFWNVRFHWAKKLRWIDDSLVAQNCDPFLMLHIWRAHWRHSWHHSAIVFVKWSKKCRSLPMEKWVSRIFHCCNNAEWDGKARLADTCAHRGSRVARLLSVIATMNESVAVGLLRYYDQFWSLIGANEPVYALHQSVNRIIKN